jgi:hypothetical protein
MANSELLQQSAEKVAEKVRASLPGNFDGYRNYIIEECINGAVFWTMDVKEVDRFMDLEKEVPIKRGHAVFLQQMITKERLGFQGTDTGVTL